MNQDDLQNDKALHSDELGASDAFESMWIDRLSEPEADLAESEDVFVASVLAKHAEDADAVEPAIAGRLRPAVLPYAAAAAVLFAALTGWFVFKSDPAGTADDGLVDVQPTPPTAPPQPDRQTPVRKVDPSKIKLGSLIAQAQSGVTRPAESLTGQLDFTKLIEVFDNPVPDLKKLLTPEESDNQQSRV